MNREKRGLLLVCILTIGLLITACISTNLKPTNGIISNKQVTIAQDAEQKDKLLAEEETAAINENKPAKALEVPHPLNGIWGVYSDCTTCHSQGALFSSKPLHSMDNANENCSTCHTMAAAKI